MNLLRPGSPTLRDILKEYREKYSPYTTIRPEELTETIGFLNGLSMPASPSTPLTPAQKEYGKAAKILRRCQRLIEVIEKHERI